MTPHRAAAGYAPFAAAGRPHSHSWRVRHAVVETGELPGAACGQVKERLLNLSMPVGHGLRLRIVERPALSLAADALAGLLGDLRSVARRVLPDGELRYGVLGGDRERLKNTVVTALYDARTGQAVAFNALSLMDAELAGRPIEVLHLGLVMVDPTLRGRRLSELMYGFTCVLLFLRRCGKPLCICSVTQVPAVVGMVAELFDDVFPTPARRRGPSEAHRLLARQIMARHRHVFGVGDDAWLDEEASIIRNAYTGGSNDLKKRFEVAPKHRESTYNAFCEGSLDYARGDDFLQIGQLNTRAVSRFLLGIAKPGRSPRFGCGWALFARLAAVLPVIRWFDNDRYSRARRSGRPVRT